MSNPMVARAVRKATLQADYQQPPVMTDQELKELFDRPAYESRKTREFAQPMTYDDVLIKATFLFTILLSAAFVGWYVVGLFPYAFCVCLALGITIGFKQKINRTLITIFAATLGLFLGGISSAYELAYSGIVLQAVASTLSVFISNFALFAFKKVRLGPNLMKLVDIATLGYALFSFFNLTVTTFIGSNILETADVTFLGMTMPLGRIVSIFAVVLASINLLIDFQVIEYGVTYSLAKKYAWLYAFGLLITVACLYHEFLRAFLR